MEDKYYFFLNPYDNRVFNKCPKCENKTKQKKLPITIQMESEKTFLNINKTCRFCENCELLIVKQQEIEGMLAIAFGKKINETDYCILGTLDENSFKEGIANPKSNNFLDTLRLFKEKWNFEV